MEIKYGGRSNGEKMQSENEDITPCADFPEGNRRIPPPYHKGDHKISMTKNKREGKSFFKDFDMPKYTKSVFGMFRGETQQITIRAENDMAGVLIDRFGKDIKIIPDDETHFHICVNVMLSPQFIAWIISLGDGVQITAPEAAVDMMREEIRRLCSMYRVVIPNN